MSNSHEFKGSQFSVLNFAKPGTKAQRSKMKFTSKDTHTHLSICVEVQDRLTSGFISVCVCEISSLVWDTNRPPSSLRGFLLCLLKVMDEQIRERERRSKRSLSLWLWWVPRIGNVSLTYYTTIVTKALLSSGFFLSYFLSSVQIKLNIKLISELLVRTDAVVSGPVTYIIFIREWQSGIKLIFVAHNHTHIF